MNNRILIIDDNREIHEDIKKILTNDQTPKELNQLEMEILGTRVSPVKTAGVIIDSALQGQEGVDMGFKAWKEGKPYSLAFVDVRMPPGLNGIETIQKLRSFDKELQFVIITAYSDYNWHQINQIVDPEDTLLILKKPFDSIEIRQMTSALTEKWILSRGLKDKNQVLQKMNQTLKDEIDENKRLEQAQQELLEKLETHVRELNCFYELTRLTQKPNISLDSLFCEFVHCIPKAFTYPDHTYARISCGTISHESADWNDVSNPARTLSAPIKDRATALGKVQVFLHKNISNFKRAPGFTPSEKLLVDVLADQITKTVERIRAEEKLKESEKQIRLIMNSTAEGIYGLDRNGICIFCNRSCTRILGYDNSEELLGNQMHDLIHHTRENGEPSALQDCPIINCCLKKIETHSSTDIFWKKDKTSFPVEYWAYPIYKNKETIGVVVTFIDITHRIHAEADRKKIQDALRQAQKMEAIGTLAGGIAHDFNNILFPLLGYAELLNEDIPPNSPLRDYTEEILKAGLRAKGLVKQILTFGRQTPHNPSIIAPHLIVNEALKLLRASISSKIKFKKNIRKNCGMILADPTHIHQIVMNLVTNASHAMEEGGTLIVTLTQVSLPLAEDEPLSLPDGQYVCLMVEDSGTGIPDKALAQIFDPYFTTKEQGKGTGLGLSVVQGIVKALKGDIQVRSNPGKGSWFGVYLPVTKNSDLVEIDVAGRISGGTEHILVVDDEKSVVQIQFTILKRLGYKITQATNSLKALELFMGSETAFDLVITDMNMPDMDGLQLARRIHQINPDIPILLCTGFSNQISQKECSACGINDIILKPVFIETLASAIRKAIDAPKTNG